MDIYKPYLWRQDNIQRMCGTNSLNPCVEIDGVSHYIHEAVYDYILRLHALIEEYEQALGGEE